VGALEPKKHFNFFQSLRLSVEWSFGLMLLVFGKSVTLTKKVHFPKMEGTLGAFEILAQKLHFQSHAYFCPSEACPSTGVLHWTNKIFLEEEKQFKNGNIG
jgi:hypothetical protein